jgi:uncharacterized phage infection (PIP) family protein YhgE
MQTIILAAVFFAMFGTSALAQKKRYPPKPKVVTTSNLPSKTGAKKVDNSSAAVAENVETTQKVSNQITNVTKFLYLLGGIAKGIEDIDKDKRANAQAIAANNENKKNVQQTIRNLRAGLAALEVDFRTKPSLKPYLAHIEGISDLAGQSETLAMSNRFADAGRPLVTVVGKLADALAEMP